MSDRPLSNIIAFDDAPFPHSHRGNVRIIGTVYAGLRFDGVLSSHVRRDGANAAKKITELVRNSKFAEHAQLIMLQGIALAGFNVVDVPYLNRRLGLPVLVVARHQPDMSAIREALLNKVPGGLRKWRLIRKLGPMEPVANVFVQRAGLTTEEARQVVEKFAIHGHIPEPLRTAHLIAGGITTGQSGRRA